MTAIFCVLARLALCAFGFSNRDVPCDIGVCWGAHQPNDDDGDACPVQAERGPIPQEVKDKVDFMSVGMLYSSVYAKEAVINNKETLCSRAAVTINTLDFIYIDFRVYVETGKYSTPYFDGLRIDNGQTAKYKWVQEANGVNTTYTLLSARDSYSVFVKDGGSSNPWLCVFSKAQTLTADELAEIGQIGKDNGIVAKLEPPQNLNCPKPKPKA